MLKRRKTRRAHLSARTLAVSAAAAIFSAALPAYAGPADFSAPETVLIEGYDGHAMEPFLSRDGNLLFFNNRNQPLDQTDIHAAQRDRSGRFIYKGPLKGTNSQALDGVPSMDARGGFYFVSPRDYGKTRNTLWRGRLEGGMVVDAEPLKGDVSRGKPLWLNMDAEISADGNTLYFTENKWKLFGNGPKSSNIYLAEKDADGAFIRPAGVKNLFKAVNTKQLEFAPATSPDERTLYFTRLNPDALSKGPAAAFGLYVATRPDRSSAFAAPQRIAAIRGFVEAVTVSPDGCAIYFHKKVDETFRIHRARKLDCAQN